MEKQVLDFLTSWKDGILNISKSYIDKDSYQKKALKFIQSHYLFDVENVLFKPTMTKSILFRNDLDSALSYFVGGSIPEDTGFAIKPWEKIDISEVSHLLENNLIIAMGVFKFTLSNTHEVTKVAFTFVLKCTDDKLKIKVHHSSIV
tara:strand:+ start:548 stop:988 length:441 start_codon:yes stop_codon:yes gene_type:complete